MSYNPNRAPKGTSTGGQFAAGDASKDEAGQVIDAFESDEQANANNWVTTSAVRSSFNPAMVEVTASVGGKYGSDEERVYMVPTDEYHARGDQRFVIDPERHRLMGHELDGEPIVARDWTPNDSEGSYAAFAESIPVDSENEYGYPRDDNGVRGYVRMGDIEGPCIIHRESTDLGGRAALYVVMDDDRQRYDLDEYGEPIEGLEYLTKEDQ